MVRPLLEKAYSCIEEVDQDIEFVSSSLLNIASSTIAKRIPHKPSRKHRIRDSFLSTLCWQSRVAYRDWKAAGCPRCGDKYEKREKTKREVSIYLSKCRARSERRHIQKRDEMFSSNNPHGGNGPPSFRS